MRLTLVGLAALAACNPPEPSDDAPPPPPPATGDTGPVEVDTGEGPPPPPPPEIATSVTPVVGQDGWLSAMLVDAVTQATVNGLPLELIETAGNGTFALWRLPPDVPVGPAQLALTNQLQETQLIDIEIAAPWFRDVATDVGLNVAQDVTGWEVGCAQSLTAVGLADVDNDGDMDVMQGNLMSTGILWLNEPGGPGQLPTFTPTDALEQVDLVTAVSFADIDNDGDKDLFLGRRGENQLYRNELVPSGDLRFTNITAASGLARDNQRTTSGGFGDYDGDGLLDLYEVNHSWCFPSTSPNVVHAQGDHLYRNVGNGGFQEVTIAMPDDGGQMSDRMGFSALWLDYDDDGDQDLWVINDFVPQTGRSILFSNEGALPSGIPRFSDATAKTNLSPQPDALGKAVNAMGTDVGDLNHDGRPDFIYTNIGPNFLMMSNPNALVWTDKAGPFGTSRVLLPFGRQSVTWGANLFDADNDADLDMFFVGGVIVGTAAMPHAVFENLGSELGDQWQEVTWSSGVSSPRKGASSAVADIDGDGYLDWLVANWDARLEVWHNELGDRYDHHWLMVEVEGDGMHVNRDGLGAVVQIEYDGNRETCWVNPRPSMAATGDFACHFGLGRSTEVTSIRIRWPNGTQQLVGSPEIDTRHRVVYAP